MKILFQGDSITDAGRDRNDPHDLGSGYPKYAAQFIRDAFPDKDFEFIDLGISGNRTENLVERLQSDFIDIGADIVSVLIGVNDTWHHAGDKSYVPAEVFEGNLRTVYGAVKETGAKLIVLEQFLLPAEDKLYWREDLDPKIQIQRKVARDYADIYVPTDGIFAAALIGHDYTEYSDDGVHPNAYGSEFLGSIYAKAFAKIM